MVNTVLMCIGAMFQEKLGENVLPSSTRGRYIMTTHPHSALKFANIRDPDLVQS